MKIRFERLSNLIVNTNSESNSILTEVPQSDEEIITALTEWHKLNAKWLQDLKDADKEGGVTGREQGMYEKSLIDNLNQSYLMLWKDIIDIRKKLFVPMWTVWNKSFDEKFQSFRKNIDKLPQGLSKLSESGIQQINPSHQCYKYAYQASGVNVQMQRIINQYIRFINVGDNDWQISHDSFTSKNIGTESQTPLTDFFDSISTYESVLKSLPIVEKLLTEFKQLATSVCEYLGSGDNSNNDNTYKRRGFFDDTQSNLSKLWSYISQLTLKKSKSKTDNANGLQVTSMLQNLAENWDSKQMKHVVQQFDETATTIFKRINKIPANVKRVSLLQMQDLNAAVGSISNQETSETVSESDLQANLESQSTSVQVSPSNTNTPTQTSDPDSELEYMNSAFDTDEPESQSDSSSSLSNQAEAKLTSPNTVQKSDAITDSNSNGEISKSNRKTYLDIGSSVNPSPNKSVPESASDSLPLDLLPLSYSFPDHDDPSKFWAQEPLEKLSIMNLVQRCAKDIKNEIVTTVAESNFLSWFTYIALVIVAMVGIGLGIYGPERFFSKDETTCSECIKTEETVSNTNSSSTVEGQNQQSSSQSIIDPVTGQYVDPIESREDLSKLPDSARSTASNNTGKNHGDSESDQTNNENCLIQTYNNVKLQCPIHHLRFMSNNTNTNSNTNTDSDSESDLVSQFGSDGDLRREGSQTRENKPKKKQIIPHCNDNYGSTDSIAYAQSRCVGELVAAKTSNLDTDMNQHSGANRIQARADNAGYHVGGGESNTVMIPGNRDKSFDRYSINDNRLRGDVSKSNRQNRVIIKQYTGSDSNEGAEESQQDRGRNLVSRNGPGSKNDIQTLTVTSPRASGSNSEDESLRKQCSNDSLNHGHGLFDVVDRSHVDDNGQYSFSQSGHITNMRHDDDNLGGGETAKVSAYRLNQEAVIDHSTLPTGSNTQTNRGDRDEGIETNQQRRTILDDGNNNLSASLGGKFIPGPGLGNSDISDFRERRDIHIKTGIMGSTCDTVNKFNINVTVTVAGGDYHNIKTESIGGCCDNINITSISVGGRDNTKSSTGVSFGGRYKTNAGVSGESPDSMNIDAARGGRENIKLNNASFTGDDGGDNISTSVSDGGINGNIIINNGTEGGGRSNSYIYNTCVAGSSRDVIKTDFSGGGHEIINTGIADGGRHTGIIGGSRNKNSKSVIKVHRDNIFTNVAGPSHRDINTSIPGGGRNDNNTGLMMGGHRDNMNTSVTKGANDNIMTGVAGGNHDNINTSFAADASCERQDRINSLGVISDGSDTIITSGLGGGRNFSTSGNTNRRDNNNTDYTQVTRGGRDNIYTSVSVDSDNVNNQCVQENRGESVCPGYGAKQAVRYRTISAELED